LVEGRRGQRGLVGQQRRRRNRTFDDLLRGRAVVDADVTELLKRLPAQIAGIERVTIQDHDFRPHDAMLAGTAGGGQGGLPFMMPLTMPVYLDDQPVNLRADSLGGILDAAARELGKRGRIVAQVELNGRVLEDAELSANQALNIGAKDLRLLSADPKELVLASIPQVCAELAGLPAMQGKIAQLLQQDHRRQAMAKLPEVLAVWQRAQQLLGFAMTLLGDAAADIEVDGQGAEQAVAALADQLRSVRELIEAGDAVAMADALAYEWPATAERWGRLLQAMARSIESASGKH
jgi:hypothetical protein